MIHVMVTSSRTWRDVGVIHTVLDTAMRLSGDGLVVVTHGDAPRGGDRIAKAWALRTPGAVDDPYPADWSTGDKTAGFKRNKRMVELAPHICLAFVNDCVKPTCRRPEPHISHGAEHAIGLCLVADVPIEVFYQPVQLLDTAA